MAPGIFLPERATFSPSASTDEPVWAESRDRGLAVDLDRVMTPEKSVVARWQRTTGCAADEETRRFARDQRLPARTGI